MNHREGCTCTCGIPIEESIEKLELNPDDLLVLKCESISDARANHIKQLFNEKFPGIKLLVVSRDVDVEVQHSA